jgi:predicted kinase
VEHRGEDGFIHVFSLDLSTEENYKTNSHLFYGPYRNFREKLDYTYHHNYKRERQILQDYIIKETLNMPEIVDAANGNICTTPTENFLVFTAGAMGAGKSYTLKWCHQRALFPLNAFVIVDPDEVRQQFPEYSLYVSQNPARAGEMTRKEAGYIVEVLTLAALQAGKNVLVDGSLRDHEWYSEYFDKLRENYPTLKIMILHVDAPRDAVFARAESRGKITGRIVPRETLELSLQQVPKSVEILKDKVDFYCKLYNAPCADGIQLLSDHLTWESFKTTWLQTCAWVPKPPASKKLRQVSGN